MLVCKQSMSIFFGFTHFYTISHICTYLWLISLVYLLMALWSRGPEAKQLLMAVVRRLVSTWSAFVAKKRTLSQYVVAFRMQQVRCWCRVLGECWWAPWWHMMTYDDYRLRNAYWYKSTVYCFFLQSTESTFLFCSILFYTFLSICVFSMSRLHSSGLRSAIQESSSPKAHRLRVNGPWIFRDHSEGEFLSVLSGGPCCSAASAAEMARQTAAATPAATGPGLLAARGHGLWWTRGERYEIVKWKNGCEEDEKCTHLILMQNAPASCKFWLRGQEVGDASPPWHLFWFSEQIALEQTLPDPTGFMWIAWGKCITNYQPNSEVFQHLSPCYFTNVPHAWFHSSGRHRMDIASFSVSQDAARRWLRVLHVKTARRRRQSEASHVKFEALLQETKTKSFEATKKQGRKTQIGNGKI